MLKSHISFERARITISKGFKFTLEKFFFKKVELWIVLLIVLVGVVGAIAFGYVVRQYSLEEKQEGWVGDLAIFVSDLPTNIDKVIKGETENLKSEEGRFSGRNGFTVHESDDSHNGDQYFLLISRYDGDKKRSVAELVDMSTYEIVHSWQPKFAQINAQIKDKENFQEVLRDYSKRRYRMVHPLLLEDGGLVFKAASPLVKVDICGELVFQNDDFKFHHSIESDLEGNLWVPGKFKKSSILEFDPRYVDDAIVKLSPSGKVLYHKSVTMALFENDLQHEMYTYDKFIKDPIHLNDIQPVNDDGPFWKKGDVFISLGHLNMIALYRPSTNEFVWRTQYRMNHQHDIDILSESEISIFDNNRVMVSTKDRVKGANEIQVYDFKTDEMRSAFRDVMAKLDIRTTSQGLNEFLPGGGVFIEETNHGRLLALDKEGNLVWEYINGSADGTIHTMNWSRIIPVDLAEKVLATKEKIFCK
jgi:hypothetical protein